jgi:hypothetical protein
MVRALELMIVRRGSDKIGELREALSDSIPNVRSALEVRRRSPSEHESSARHVNPRWRDGGGVVR